MRYLFAAILAAMIAIAPVAAQAPQTPLVQAPPVASAKAQAPQASDSALELPADQTVDPSEGFVTITAKTKGTQVRWLVVSLTGDAKVKYLPIDLTNSVVVSVPPAPGTVIAVFAVANVDGKLTDFARTTVTVAGTPKPSPPTPTPPGPTPTPPGPTPTPPGPAPVAGPLHVTFVVDLNKTNTATAQLLNSATLREAITKGGAYFRLYDAGNPVVARKKIDAVYRRVNAAAMMLVQDKDGKVLSAEPVATSEQAILEAIERAAGGK